MSTDNIDELPDAELSEVFAVEVAGWTQRPRWPGSPLQAWFDANGVLTIDERGEFAIDPFFATSADAVLPYLERYENVETQCFRIGGVSHRVRIRGVGEKCRWFTISTGKSATFARAACLALIRAKRAEAGK